MFRNRSKSVNLELLHEEFELNYRRLNRIMGKTDEVGYSTSYILDEIFDGAVSLYVIEVTKYTSLVRISAPKLGPTWLADIDLKVRVYRDAKMAEETARAVLTARDLTGRMPLHLAAQNCAAQTCEALLEMMGGGGASPESAGTSLERVETSRA